MCPACLIRLALEPETAGTPDAEPAACGGAGTRWQRSARHGLPRSPAARLSILATVKLLNVEHQHSIEPDGFCARVRELAARLESIPHAGLTPCLEAGVTAGGRIYVVAPDVVGSPVESYLSNRRCSASERVAIPVVCARSSHISITTG